VRSHTPCYDVLLTTGLYQQGKLVINWSLPTVSQNKLFFFLSWLCWVFCHSNRKLITRQSNILLSTSFIIFCSVKFFVCSQCFMSCRPTFFSFFKWIYEDFVTARLPKSLRSCFEFYFWTLCSIVLYIDTYTNIMFWYLSL
jgi:hypothetical protein